MIRHSPRSRRGALSALQCRRAQKISRFAYLYPFCLLVEPSNGQRLKKRGPGIGETPDNSHYAFEKRSLAGKNLTGTRRQGCARILLKAYALLTQRLSLRCQSVVVPLSLGGSAQADQRVGGSGPSRFIKPIDRR